jgi:glycosyltransferase involved in cell wall biosynthesis
MIRNLILRFFALFEWSRASKGLAYMPRIPKGVGGPRSFLTQLKDALQLSGYGITHNKYSDFKVALVPIACDLDIAKEWKRKGKKIVQRLDGLFYDTESGDFDPVLNGTIPQIYHEYADAIIFQSNYSKSQCAHFLGSSDASSQTVIYNGVDLDLFVPKTIDLSPSCWEFVTTGNFRDASMIFPILEALDALQSDGLKFKWELIGPIAQSDWANELRRRDYVSLAGSLPLQMIAKKLSSAHLFLFSFLNPNCPNSVLEATASGLPVVSFDSGSLSELCDFNRDLLAEVSQEVIHTRSDLASAAFRQKIEIALDGIERYRNNAIENRKRFCLRETAKKYTAVLCQAT